MQKSHLSLQGRVIKILYLTLSVLLSYQIHILFTPFRNSEETRKSRSRLHRRKARQLCETALQLKGILIKIGQFMSTRVDLLPLEYTDELATLQDQVPPEPFPSIRKRIIQELGREPSTIFTRFNEEPIAAASLGQVHEAWLKDGSKVAVKVQYLGIQEIVKTDLRAIRWVTRLLQWQFRTIRFDLLYKEFSRLLLEELNYIQEARNAEQFSKNFTGDQRIVVPKVIWEYTTPHILALEYVEGIKINNVEALRSQGIKTKEIAQLLVESYMRQILLHRFFHGDPHPGNLFVQPGPRLVFVDFGLMQRITPSVDKAIKQTMTAIIQRETEGIIQGLMDLGFIVRTDNPADLEQVTTYFMDKYREMSPKEFREITVADVAEDLSKLLRIYPFLQIPNTFILFARAAGMLNGLNATLDPDLNIVDLAKPFAQQYIGEERGWLETALIQGKEWGATLFDLPQQLEEFLKLARRGEFKTRMSSEDVTGILTRFYKLALRLTLGLFAAFLLFLPKPLQEAIPPFLHSLSGLVGILILVAILWSLLRELLKTP